MMLSTVFGVALLAALNLHDAVAMPQQQQQVPAIYEGLLPGLLFSDAAIRNWWDYWKYINAGGYYLSDAYQQAHNQWMQAVQQSGIYGDMGLPPLGQQQSNTGASQAGETAAAGGGAAQQTSAAASGEPTYKPPPTYSG